MAAVPKKEPEFPNLPPTLSHHDDPFQDYPGSHTRGADLTPYLGLRSRLSQIWFNRWTVLLMLVLVRVLFMTKTVDENVFYARQEALSGCSGVETLGSAFASMPHYLGGGVNELAASGIEHAVKGLMQTLALTVEGAEQTIIFFINALVGTYSCLLLLAIHGGLDVAVNVVDSASKSLNDTIKGISGDIQDEINSFTSSLNTFLNKLSDVSSFLTGGASGAPKLTIPALDRLNKLQFPDISTVEAGLVALNKTVPTFDQLQNSTASTIQSAFQNVLFEIQQMKNNFTFDRRVFPVPEKTQLTFCSDNPHINNFFDNLLHITAWARRIFIIVCVVLAVLVIIPMWYREVWRWRSTKKRAKLVRANQYDPLDVTQIVSRPYTSTIGIKAAARFKKPRHKVLVRWVVAYATSVPALLLVSLGIAGLFSCLCQYVFLRSLVKETPALANEVGQFADLVINKLNDSSLKWADSVNGVVDDAQGVINEDILKWVNTSTSAVNQTLNDFVDGMNKAMTNVFHNTPLQGPLEGILNCLVTIKVRGIQKGITWVQDNAHVEFPRLPNTTFSLGAIASIVDDSNNATESFLSNPKSQATDLITSAVVRLTNSLENGIRTEAIISAVLIGIWFLIGFIALIRACTRLYGREKPRGEGGAPPAYTGEYRSYSTPSSPRGSVFEGTTDGSPVAAGARTGTERGMTEKVNDTTIAPVPTNASSSRGVPVAEEYEDVEQYDEKSGAPHSLPPQDRSGKPKTGKLRRSVHGLFI